MKRRFIWYILQFFREINCKLMDESLISHKFLEFESTKFFREERRNRIHEKFCNLYSLELLRSEIDFTKSLEISDYNDDLFRVKLKYLSIGFFRVVILLHIDCTERPKKIEIKLMHK